MTKTSAKNLSSALPALTLPLLIVALLATPLAITACGRGDVEASPYSAAELQNRALELDQRQAALDQQSVELASRAAKLEETRASLATRQDELEAREGKLGKREARAADREATVAASERRLQDERERLAGERVALDERADQIAERAVAEREAREREAEKRAAEERAKPVYAEARIPAGSIIDVEFLNTVSSGSSRVGETFRTRVDHDLYSDDGLLAAPAGSEVVGTVVEAVRVKKIGGRARLGLRFDELILPSGERVAIEATLFEAGRNETGRDAATIGGAVAGGAILGHIIDDDDGSLIGALIGAAAGTAAAASQGRDVEIPAGALVSLRLEAPVRVKVPWKPRQR